MIKYLGVRDSTLFLPLYRGDNRELDKSSGINT